MSAEVQANSIQEQPKENNKEYNFRALETKYEKKLADERSEKERLAREIEEIKRALNQNNINDDVEDDSEPYVDHKKLNKKLAKFEEKTDKKTQTNIQKAVQDAINQERKQNWLNQNADFYEVMQNHAAKLLEKAPQIAETILKMPDTFERQQLVYHNIKTLGLDKPEQKQSSVQEKIDANRKSPYYQPSGIGTAPYAAAGDFSPSGQQNAYKKMQELKSRLRLG